MHMHPIFNHQISDPAMAPDVSLGPTIGLLHLQPPPTQPLSRWGSGDWKPWPIERWFSHQNLHLFWGFSIAMLNHQMVYLNAVQYILYNFRQVVKTC